MDYEQNGQSRVAGAQLVQGMKCLQEMAATGNWDVAWPHACCADPTRVRRHGAKEEEIETVLNYVKMLKDLESTIAKTVPTTTKPEAPQGAQGEGEEVNAGKKPKWWKKGKKKDKE